jgi:hypothetical protein
MALVAFAMMVSLPRFGVQFKTPGLESVAAEVVAQGRR